MTVTQSNSLQTPLYFLSVESKAKFTDFAGWEMALQYSGLKKEHQAVRESVGMFDISHMGKFSLQGKALRSSLNYLVPSDLSNLESGQAQYSVLLNHKGGIIDDIIFYYQGGNEENIESGILIVNASTTSKDWHWLTENLKNQDIELKDNSRDLALIALQGKNAVEYLNPLVTEDLTTLPSFGHLTTEIDAETVFIARTGYTGEDGFEIMTTPTIAQKLWKHFLGKNVTPCGLGCRDTLRLEACMGLYGQDMNEEITPLEAGISWVVNFNHDFIGKDILLTQKQEKVKKRLVAIEMEGKYIARHDYPILINNQVVGHITSGTLSPTLNKAIALGYVPYNYSKIGQKLDIEIREKLYPARIVKKPFYHR
ncbi:MAG: glycine cleavage system aminomethyltransferase GcvT [Cyanobacteria bacterium]|nr:glycine cleavage system aminomethyltransferase GcvT [Cyanobacteria bacterium CG_2015-16_32_12]NCO78128.1 glycine cleavage system aminomethyltransferase GcvT [Cyanobacteria bacterium CG_2015-22_32_23]NCQ04621.1 glycine cleavage system aminomethyltransferase GcvT [Cyanobacteria bacterium CG_2015-09_32_10]NCQ40895.1 glycine cleavage system aminomethyltransferase GcvT [Cyanobacteria bacterium CG_2015-04_32_10]NCS84922.1 glycine cleavage system aminomethyltransferase GcvT [Cyanobacteria bacterium